MNNPELTKPQSKHIPLINHRGSVNATGSDTVGLAKEIIRDMLRYRRVVDSEDICDPIICESCIEPHIAKVVSSIKKNQPITFILPAFPAKSPNLEKVFSPLPDMAERCSLNFLNSLCDQIKLRYKHGAKLVLCSDGRVFSDMLGMKESDVTAYHAALEDIIKDLELTNITTFSLDHLTSEENFDNVRTELMKKYGRSEEALRERVLRGGKEGATPGEKESHRMYLGITRFLVEDSMHSSQTMSRTALQKECRARAYHVILRSNAWSELLAERFPNAVRLSIHPQACGAPKLGIQLIGTERWMTPWHGVAVDNGNGFILMKRSEAEKLPVELVYDTNGSASHYKLLKEA